MTNDYKTKLITVSPRLKVTLTFDDAVNVICDNNIVSMRVNLFGVGFPDPFVSMEYRNPWNDRREWENVYTKPVSICVEIIKDDDSKEKKVDTSEGEKSCHTS